ncbi:MAG: Transcriptional regulator [Alectoria fallacina]|uniref:Transcriptional regulator n=1 Tax=Alectoria fallacina TaxID=1903189 RepID=A0A8H3PIM6_9LECA|nr:MAG: Transcriptional regulator [Alectoria fallacina]
MPPLVGKSKPKGREGRQSRSRNSTPSSSVSAHIVPSHTAFLDILIGNLMVPTNISYDDILERHGGAGGIPDPSHLTTMAKDLKQLSELASVRSDTCNAGMRALSEKRKEALDEERQREQEARAREAEERETLKTLKKEAEEEDDEIRGRKGGKLKKKKERSSVREERPLAHGAHGLARQDGLDLPLKASPSQASKDTPSPRKRKLDAVSGSSSSLSEASPLASPLTAPPPLDPESARPSPSPSTSSDGAHQPLPAASVAQYPTFGLNPVTFDDPTIYEIRPITEDMTDEEKKEIYCVASFPHDDLHDLIAIPRGGMDKDFSNAVKPNNQVAAHTFSAYLDNYLRPLKEEDYGFLNERGDRVTPFVMPRRGKRHYTDVWAEEDGSMSRDTPEQDRLPPNQPRGNLDQLDDELAETDQISGGPLLNRLLSTMRFEHRTPPTEEKSQPNGLPNGIGESSLTNGDLPNGTGHDSAPTEEANSKSQTIPPATALPSFDRPPPNTQNLSHAQIDERLKAELRHIGFLSPDNEPDYDAHYDDEIAERLRYLQEKLREVSLVNGARKQRILELAHEQMAYQEFATILEDLDGQVQQAYLKRTRTLGKTKKNTKRPGGAGGGSHPIQGGVSTANGAVGGISKPGIGDVARQVMNRRADWEASIGPVFSPDIRRVRGPGEGIFTDDVMEPLMRQERERWEEGEE